MSTTGYSQTSNGFWYKITDQSGPYAYGPDGVMYLVGSGRSGPTSYTWATLPSAADYPYAGAVVTNGTERPLLVTSDGTRWRPVGHQLLKRLGAAVTGLTNVEAISLQYLFPAGMLGQYDGISLEVAFSKSGATDALVLTARWGQLGTTGDSAITGFSAFLQGSTTMRAGGAVHELKLPTTTSVQKMGANLTNTSYFSATATGVIAAATVIADVTANPSYLSVALLSNGATDTVNIDSAKLWWS